MKFEEKYEALSGAWEEPGVIGTRIEIEKNEITILWRGAPVLETTFELTEASCGFLLSLSENGMHYADSDSVYATVKELVFLDDKLTLTEFFPISGESVKVLRKTDKTRYGAYDLVPEALREVEGTWKDKSGFFRIEIRGNSMKVNDRETTVCALRERNSACPKTFLRDADPSVDTISGFSRFEYDGKYLLTRMFVCDAPAIDFVFERTGGSKR